VGGRKPSPVHGRASISKTNQLGHTQNLVALLDNADEAGREALRRQIKQQLKLLVSKIMVHVEGKPWTKNKKVDCTIHFKNGVERRVWFQTGKKAVADGMWSADGKFPMEDVDAFTVMALESLDPAELPEGAAEFLEKRRRGEVVPHGKVHDKITPLEE
jgi:hypothetical protein